MQRQRVSNFVASMGEQELTQSYKVNTVSFLALCSLYLPKIIKFCRFIHF